jgi:subtilisin-like proprotein convertase family protein
MKKILYILVSVLPQLIFSQTFSNTADVCPPDNNTTGTTSVIPVSGTGTTLTSVTVNIPNISHTFYDDLDIMLISPTGQRLILMSDCGGDNSGNGNRNYTFVQGGSSLKNGHQPTSSGNVSPTNYGGDSWPDGAATITTMNQFTGNPNGNWTIRVIDDAGGDTGCLIGGWSITIVATTPLPMVTTSAVSYTSGTSATGAGNVTSDGGCTVTDRGVCWSSTNATPTIADSYASDATLATGTGAFNNVPMTVGYSSVVYYRAYATCASGTVYGNVLSFTTETPAGAPLPTGFYISGTVTNNGTIISTNDQNWLRMTGTSKQVTGSGVFTDTRIFADGSTQINPTSSLSFTQTYVNASKSLEVLTGKTMNNGSMTNLGTLTLSGTGAINNSDYWTNSGTVTATSTSLVTFSGSSDHNVTSGGSAFGKVTLNNSSSGTYEGIVLQDAMTVNGALTFTDGNIQLGAHNLTIGASGTVVTPSATSHVITASSGVVTKNTLGATEFTFPVGTSKSSYTPIKLANSGTADNFSVYVTDNVLDGGTTGSTYNIGRVSKTWHVSEATGGGSSVTMTPYWTSADEDAQFDRTVALVSHWDGSAWDMSAEASAQTSGGLYYVSRSELSSFSPFMVQRSSFSPLPITLSFFDGTCNPEGNELTWVTSSEQNSSHFDVKRSYDGIKWEHVGQKQGAGNSSTDIEYSVWDVEGSRHEVTYYELHQFDFDNALTVYGPIAVRCANDDSPMKGSLSPNPTIEASYLAIENCPLGEATITLMSSIGQVIYTDRIMVTKKNDVYFIDSFDLTRGSYVVRFQASNGQIVAMKLVKN